MEIERLQKEDILLYKDLIDGCFGQSTDIEQYQKYELNGNYDILVAKENNEIMGSVTLYKIDLFTFDFQPCLMLFNVAVKQTHRRKKVAETLLNHVKKFAKDNGYRSISLTCLDDAYPAHKLYESVGFKKASSIKYNLSIE
ncbi:GNAT family N-acetyltransferase [Paludicola sp. MB14-C6]|uniref:GNAT family N-acetyltransferase n=1 Tax=Paludihabitans sp. MB14-C6 TaxID=3070656 RepID=UPI0027DE62CA|nr:GNAT family N-acetyltransferase [Paludicola sp. MB14-C6]WMJ23976.1 GNAT family N-acetyltransferase [Paludicola sp. MB14-C6]